MGTTIYTWNPLTDSVIEESDELGNVLVTYTNESTPFGPLVSENRGGQTSYYHFDALGSTRLMTNSSQTVTDAATYDAWGTKVASTGTNPTPYRWCGCWGYQLDSALGSNYVRARTYQPTTACWSSIDPLSTIRRIQIRHAFLLYAYGNNTPSYSADPAGTDVQTPFLPPQTNPGYWQLLLPPAPFVPERMLFPPLPPPSFQPPPRLVPQRPWLVPPTFIGPTLPTPWRNPPRLQGPFPIVPPEEPEHDELPPSLLYPFDLELPQGPWGGVGRSDPEGGVDATLRWYRLYLQFHGNAEEGVSDIGIGGGVELPLR